MNEPLKLSVIICTYNRQKYIYDVLKSIAENAFPHERYELLVIDNNSSDNTAQECARFHADFPDVVYRYYIEPNQGLSHARNRGIAEATGDIIVYVDDDATVNTGYLQAYYCFFEKYPAAAAAGGPVIPVYETERPPWMSYFTERLVACYFYKGEKIKPFRGGFPCGGNAAYRKEVFDRVGLFNVNLGRTGGNLIGAEEKDLFDKMRSLKIRFYYVPGAILYHIIPPGKLTTDYFNTLTLSIGKSEQLRTRAISKRKYATRLGSETVKWGASLVLFMFYLLTLRPAAAARLLVFRWNVSRGLIPLFSKRAERNNVYSVGPRKTCSRTHNNV